MEPMTSIAHQFLLPALHTQAVCVDATLGYGHDTDFFVSHGAAKVFAYDISAQKIEQAKQRFALKPVFLYCRSHEHLMEDLGGLAGRIDAAVFNFGYDPKAPGTDTTNPETSLHAVMQMCSLLKCRGRMALVFYMHESGRREAKMIEEALKKHSDSLEILKVTREDKNSSPYLLLVQKQRAMRKDCDYER